MKPDTTYWREQGRYEYLDTLTTEGLAWEFLRRNEDYQKEYEQLVVRNEVDAPLSSDAQRRWGLRFRGTARAFGPGARRPLVTGRGSGRPGPRTDT